MISFGWLKKNSYCQQDLAYCPGLVLFFSGDGSSLVGVHCCFTIARSTQCSHPFSIPDRIYFIKAEACKAAVRAVCEELHG